LQTIFSTKNYQIFSENFCFAQELKDQNYLEKLQSKKCKIRDGIFLLFAKNPILKVYFDEKKLCVV